MMTKVMEIAGIIIGTCLVIGTVFWSAYYMIKGINALMGIL